MSIFNRPDDREYAALVAENAFIDNLQMEIERAMKMRSMSQADLAKAMGVSEARVSQILSGNGKNLQARTIARIAFAVGVLPDLSFRDEIETKASINAKSHSRQAPELATWVEKAFAMRARNEKAYQVNDNFWVENLSDELEVA